MAHSAAWNCFVLFGLLTFVWPGITLLTLVLFYGAFAVIDGVFAIAAAIRGDQPAPRWWLAIVGLLGIAAGILAFLLPGITALVLLLLIAGWAIQPASFRSPVRSGCARKLTTNGC